MFFFDFRGVVFASQKSKTWSRRWSKMASSPPVMVQIVQIITHPFAHTLKGFVYVKPPRYLKVSLSAIYISTIQEPTTIRKERKREFTIALVDDRFSLLSVYFHQCSISSHQCSGMTTSRSAHGSSNNNASCQCWDYCCHHQIWFRLRFN